MSLQYFALKTCFSRYAILTCINNREMIFKTKALYSFIASTVMLDLINSQKENDLAETLSLYILATRKHQVHINIDQ